MLGVLHDDKYIAIHSAIYSFWFHTSKASNNIQNSITTNIHSTSEFLQIKQSQDIKFYVITQLMKIPIRSIDAAET